jgi:hypothetical protein
MLLIDLKSFGKKGQHEVKVSEALKMTAVWIGVSLLFCGGIYLFYPGDSHEKAMEFLAGYLIEKSLSMDNLFVFLMLFFCFEAQVGNFDRLALAVDGDHVNIGPVDHFPGSVQCFPEGINPDFHGGAAYIGYHTLQDDHIAGVGRGLELQIVDGCRGNGGTAVPDGHDSGQFINPF